jgi:large subunit ribosomal protein L40e
MCHATVSSSALQVVSYTPAPDSTVTMATARMEEDKDAGLLTVGYFPAPGLQVQVPEHPDDSDEPEQWVDVSSGHDAIIVMVGHTLEHATGGVLRACLHRMEPSTSMPERTLLAFKLRARSTATLPRGFMLVDRRYGPGHDEGVEVSELMQTFRETHGPSLNGTSMVSVQEQEQQVRCRMVAEMQTPIPIYIKCICGKRFVLECETLMCTVREIKRRLQPEVGLSMKKIRLLFDGKDLEDGKPLAESNVQSDSTLRVALRVPGEWTAEDNAWMDRHGDH